MRLRNETSRSWSGVKSFGVMGAIRVSQERELCSFACFAFRKAHADTEQAHRFPGPGEAFVQQRHEVVERERQACAFHGRAGEVVELQLHKDLRDRTLNRFLRQLRREFLEQSWQLQLA